MPELDLPWPPTANTYWRHVPWGKGVRSLISRQGRQYRERVQGEALRQGGQARIQGAIRVEIHAYPPDRRRRDLDNLLKAALDAMGHAGVYEDDSQITALSVTRERVEKPGRLRVVVTSMEDGR